MNRSPHCSNRPDAPTALGRRPRYGAHDRSRTDDLTLTKGVLYQLSYMGEHSINARTRDSGPPTPESAGNGTGPAIHGPNAGDGRAPPTQPGYRSKNAAPSGSPRPATMGPAPAKLERVMGIEPTPSAWKAEVLPLNYTRGLKGSPSNRVSVRSPPGAPARLGSARVTWWRGEDSNLRRLSRQIYSLIPLTAREPLRNKRRSIGSRQLSVNPDTEAAPAGSCRQAGAGRCWYHCRPRAAAVRRRGWPSRGSIDGPEGVPGKKIEADSLIIPGVPKTVSPNGAPWWT